MIFNSEFALVAYDNNQPNEQNAIEYTALHVAVKAQKINFIQYLFTLPNLQVNAQSRMGSTALHIAAREGIIEVVKLLLKHPLIDLTIKNNAGKTPLDIAKAQRKRTGSAKYKIIRDVLLQAIQDLINTNQSV